MTGSDFASWLDSRSSIRFNLARSGAPPRSLEDLSLGVQDLRTRFSPDVGWRSLMERIAYRHSLSPANATLTPGPGAALYLACAAVLEPNDRVLVESPGRRSLHSAPRLLGAQVGFFQREAARSYALEADQVEAMLSPGTKLVIATNLHDPSGAAATKQSIQDLLALADRYGFYLLLEESALELLPSAGQHSAASLSARALAVRTIEGAYGLEGLGMGWLLASSKLSQRAGELRDLICGRPSHLSRMLCESALDLSERLLSSVLNQADRNRWAVDAFIAQQPNLDWAKPPNGVFGWVQARDTSVEDLIRRLEDQYDTTLAPGRFFGDANCFRIGFGLDSDDLREGLDRIGLALQQ